MGPLIYLNNMINLLLCCLCSHKHWDSKSGGRQLKLEDEISVAAINSTNLLYLVVVSNTQCLVS